MVHTCYSDIWGTFVPMCLCWHEECFPIVQLNRHSSCMRDFCIVCSVMFRLILGSERGPHEPMVIEIKAVLQDVFFFLWRCQPLFLMLSQFWSGVVSRSQWWTLTIFVLYGLVVNNYTTMIFKEGARPRVDHPDPRCICIVRSRDTWWPLF